MVRTQNSEDTGGEAPTQSHTVTHHLGPGRDPGHGGACSAVSREAGPCLGSALAPSRHKDAFHCELARNGCSLTKLNVPERGFLLVLLLFFSLKYKKIRASGHQMPRVSEGLQTLILEPARSCGRLGCPPPPGASVPGNRDCWQGAGLAAGAPLSTGGREVPTQRL